MSSSARVIRSTSKHLFTYFFLFLLLLFTQHFNKKLWRKWIRHSIPRKQCERSRFFLYWNISVQVVHAFINLLRWRIHSKIIIIFVWWACCIIQVALMLTRQTWIATQSNSSVGTRAQLCCWSFSYLNFLFSNLFANKQTQNYTFLQALFANKIKQFFLARILWCWYVRKTRFDVSFTCFMMKQQTIS